MDEYIDREEAMLRLSKWLEKASDTNNRGLYNFGEIAAYQTAIVEINSIPAADVRPVVRGKWIKRRFTESVYGVTCSVCHTTWDNRSNFCPFCGADMRGDEDER